ncbi:Caspase domain-containing protein [Bradyrhizobium yuanmingense]|uniref:Caspase domain-containing protein n=2 Tax=Bradyrhizobium yuanmingense TaxID=108015 RepID=A0A1C3WCD2_9BRAD|nr:caspase domain-containing protein [Bradyrhizobium yuanmingense]SCB37535.1 Caspase domain-containing protein [Bradyrhizobium yuanmingense]
MTGTRYFNRLARNVAALATACMAGLATPAWAEKRVALVIGNDLYPNLPADRQLKKAANDATTVADALRSLGFDIVLGTNLGRQGMIDRLADFTSRLVPGDTAAVFYAGHGVAIAGVNYLVPSDVPTVNEGAEARVRGASIAEPDVIAELQAKAVRVAFVVIDACRDNPFPRAAGRSIGNTRGLADARPARGIFTLYSAGIGQTALDQLGSNDTAHNSVFTRIFVEQLKRPELHLGDLAVEVRERVAALALTATDAGGQAAPHEQTPAYYDQTLGGRIFLWNAESSNGAPKVAGMLVKPLARPAVAERATMRPPRPSAAGESCARSGFETYCVSSMLKPQFGNSYGAANLFDASTGTAWVEGASGNGVGEWITIEFETVRRVKSIHVQNGYQKSRDIFAKNNRVRQIRVLFSGGESQTFVLDDKLSAQLLMLRPPVSAHWMQFIIDDVWAGNKYTDTAITKLLVNSDPVQ